VGFGKFVRKGMVLKQNEKTYNGLALLSIHRQLTFEIEEVIDDLTNKNRKFDFIN
jgi:hypothetical protein